MTQTTKIRHVGITVVDMEDSIRVYGQLGFVVQFDLERHERFIGDIVGIEGAKIRVAMLRRGDAFLELLQYLIPKTPERRWNPPMYSPYTAGRVHVCLEGDETLAKQANECLARRGSGVIPDGPQAGARAWYFTGPDGEIIEIFEPAPPQEVVSQLSADRGIEKDF